MNFLIAKIEWQQQKKKKLIWVYSCFLALKWGRNKKQTSQKILDDSADWHLFALI